MTVSHHTEQYLTHHIDANCHCHHTEQYVAHHNIRRHLHLTLKIMSLTIKTTTAIITLGSIPISVTSHKIKYHSPNVPWVASHKPACPPPYAKQLSRHCHYSKQYVRLCYKIQSSMFAAVTSKPSMFIAATQSRMSATVTTHKAVCQSVSRLRVCHSLYRHTVPLSQFTLCYSQ